MKRSFPVLILLFLAECASKPVLNKSQLMNYMNKGENQELIEDFEKNYWRLYQIQGKGEFSGKDIAIMFKISDKCRKYYVDAHKMLFTGPREVNPRLAAQSSTVISQVISRYEENVNTVCSRFKAESAFEKTDLSQYFFEEMYPELFEDYKSDLDELRYLQRKKEKEERGG